MIHRTSIRSRRRGPGTGLIGLAVEPEVPDYLFRFFHFMGEDIIGKMLLPYLPENKEPCAAGVVTEAVLFLQRFRDGRNILDDVVEEPALLQNGALVHTCIIHTLPECSRIIGGELSCGPSVSGRTFHFQDNE